MIRIKPSPTPDTHSCDFKTVTKDQLLESSRQHINDVELALEFFVGEIRAAQDSHDLDKLSKIDDFHADFVTGFRQHDWWDRHRRLSRHHLQAPDGVPTDVNLVDVLDMIADCVMAGMARTGTVYPLELPDAVLRRAFDNTVEMLKAEVVVENDPVTDLSPKRETHGDGL